MSARSKESASSSLTTAHSLTIQAARTQQIQEQLARKLRAEGHESRKSAEVSAQGAAVGVGLIQESK